MFVSGRGWIFTASATAIVLGGAALVLSLPGYRPQDFLARRMQARVSDVAEPEVVSYVRRMAELGDAGVSAAVQTLGSDRDCEAEAAEIALRERIAQWRMLPLASEPRVLHLAKELAMQTAALAPIRRRVAADLVTQLILWPVTDADLADELVTHCEQTLRASRPERKDSAASPAPAVLASPPLSSPPRR